MKDVVVSVIIPVYNGREYIEKAIASVISQNVELEIIVIEDASKETSEDIINKFSHYKYVTYLINQTNMGVAATRNRGIKEAKGKYIAFLDADDWWEEGKLIKQLDEINRREVALVYSGRQLVDNEGSLTGKIISVPKTTTFKQLLKGNVIPCSSVIMRKDIAENYLQHNDELHEDYIMWLEILRDGNMAYGINEPLLYSRMSCDGKSRNKVKSAKMTMGVYKLFGINIIKRYYLFVIYTIKGILKYK